MKMSLPQTKKSSTTEMAQTSVIDQRASIDKQQITLLAQEAPTKPEPLGLAETDVTFDKLIEKDKKHAKVWDVPEVEEGEESEKSEAIEDVEDLLDEVAEGDSSGDEEGAEET